MIDALLDSNLSGTENSVVGLSCGSGIPHTHNSEQFVFENSAEVKDVDTPSPSLTITSSSSCVEQAIPAPCTTTDLVRVVEPTESHTLQTPTSLIVSGKEASSSSSSGLCVLDICCGTGTIGICAAIKAKQLEKELMKEQPITVLGVELCAAAVENARVNAALNGLCAASAAGDTKSADAGVASSAHSTPSTGILCAEFICARAEEILGDILNLKNQKYCSKNQTVLKLKGLLKDKKFLAVVDPPREGMHGECLRAIRNCSEIKRLVYVACNPVKALVRDAVQLCGPKSNRLFGPAFKPVGAIPVDLFPMTPHCEMIMIFDR